MPELLPRIREVIEDAEADGATSPAKIAELRAKLKWVEEQLADEDE